MKQISKLLEIAKEELSGEPSEENALNALLMITEAKNLLNKALVMPVLPVGLVEGSNCDDNFKAGWIACWNAIKGQF